MANGPVGFQSFGNLLGVQPRLTPGEVLRRQTALGRRQRQRVAAAGPIGQQRGRGARAAGGAATTLGGVSGLFDETGLPTRLPRNQQEAMLFQLQGARSAAQFQRQATRSALATLRFGVGLTQRASPFSLAGALSPLLSQQAGIQAGQQFQAPDFSFFLRPEAFGGGALTRGTGRGLAPLGLGRRVPSQIGLRFPPEPNIGFGPPGGIQGQVPVTPIDPFGAIPGPQLQDLGAPALPAPGQGGGGGLFDMGEQDIPEFGGPGGGGLFGGL
jgi:hypothetical protein